MQVLKKRVARLEKYHGGEECSGCMALFARRAVYLANQPTMEKEFDNDEEARAWWDSQSNPDWRALPAELRLIACPDCGETNPRVSFLWLRQCIERAHKERLIAGAENDCSDPPHRETLKA